MDVKELAAAVKLVASVAGELFSRWSTVAGIPDVNPFARISLLSLQLRPETAAVDVRFLRNLRARRVANRRQKIAEVDKIDSDLRRLDFARPIGDQRNVGTAVG